MNRQLQNLLIARVAELLSDCRHVAVGAASPIPAAGSLLAQYHNPELRVSLLGSETHTAFTDGGRELFDCAAQGRIDAFFLSGVQIDGSANINLVGTGNYPLMQQRFSGSFGSAYLYHLIPKVILFCWAHSPATLVESVDFISAAGPQNDGVWRSGGPSVLLTNRCEFSYNAAQQRFALARLHLEESIDSIASNTGFSYDIPGKMPTCQAGAHHDNDARNDSLNSLLSKTILPQLETTYPRFVERYLSNPDAG